MFPKFLPQNLPKKIDWMFVANNYSTFLQPPVSWFCPRGEEIATQSVKGTNWNYPSFASIAKILNTFPTLFLNASCARVPRQPPFFSNFLFFSKQQPATNFWQISRRKWRLLVLSLSFDGILNNHESNSSFLLMRVHLCRLLVISVCSVRKL